MTLKKLRLENSVIGSLGRGLTGYPISSTSGRTGGPPPSEELTPSGLAGDLRLLIGGGAASSSSSSLASTSSYSVAVGLGIAAGCGITPALEPQK